MYVHIVMYFDIYIYIYLHVYVCIYDIHIYIHLGMSQMQCIWIKALGPHTIHTLDPYPFFVYKD